MVKVADDLERMDQSSFEQSKFMSPGGTVPDAPEEEDWDNRRESLIIFKEVIEKALTSPKSQGTPIKDAFNVLMSSTPQSGSLPKLQRNSGLPIPNRSKAQKRDLNRTPEEEANVRPRLQSS